MVNQPIRGARSLQVVSLSDKKPSGYFLPKTNLPHLIPTRPAGPETVGKRKILATRILKSTGMRKATYKDRETVVSILLGAFKNNKSVNYIASKEEAKIRYLMEYSFENCMDCGEVFVSDDGNACAMIQFPDRKKFSWKSTYLDIQLILKTIGVGNIRKALARESFIKKHYPKERFTYL
jgi:hypothetical protein